MTKSLLCSEIFPTTRKWNSTFKFADKKNDGKTNEEIKESVGRIKLVNWTDFELIQLRWGQFCQSKDNALLDK